MRVPTLPAVLLLLFLGAPARAEESPGPLESQTTATLLEALVTAAPDRTRAIERVLRARGATVAAAVRRAQVGAAKPARARLQRLLARIELDWHRTHVPAGMVYVPAGPLELPREEAPWGPSGRRAQVPAFYIDRTEVTVAAWRAWLERLDAQAPGRSLREGLRRPPVGAGGDMPVCAVRWAEARRYAHEVRRGRLPTAAEFERAMRGSSVATYPWGEVMREGLANLRDFGPGQPRPVGSYPRGAGPFGALDVVGNVAEWSATHVRQGRSGRFPLLMGGSYADAPKPGLLWRAPPAMRARLGPEERSLAVGFRVAADPPALP